ncbi:transcription termination/antitermination protein NusG [endosymbiont of Euscepes postfasciatus]|uniref:transcription termination/antitermination protein NusG n=1 Tax=endosymbiont of Euscepes postfasciatus TaxID=650377 RepID=UPI000DC6E05A|nr:transcription termination/antitermination protein NusG [endosymbiont of Euscepes postfasciatus]BBA84704.1 transcription termination/antitermination protein NusG [endosymbiont of Euscepes postfasciatus]
MENINNKWYVLKVLSGSEDKVLKYIKYYSNYFNVDKYFKQIIIPKEEIIEIKNGKKIKSKRKFLPGYILLNMEVNDKTINMINKIKNVFGFIKSGSHLSYIPDDKINNILEKIKISCENPKPKILFNIGEIIRIKDGPFVDFNGKVENIDYSKNRITVYVSIFGRNTPVNLNFSQIEKII